jgi:hypothetical protein
MRPSIHQKVIDLIKEKYKILEILDLVYYDCRLNELNQILQKYQNYTFSPDERIVILHHDTDYYPSGGDVMGNNIYNLFKLLARNSIPMEFAIMFTNHYGIISEVDQLCRNILNQTPPKIIYTALWYDFPCDLENLSPIKYQNIEHLYACLNGVERTHRVLTLSYLNHNDLLSRGMISYFFKNE